jgi:trimethylamine:corrinoid methyltransferase-like protein
MSNGLFEKLLRVVEVKGVAHTLKILDDTLVEEIKFDNPLVENIITTVCKKFKISVQELIHGNGRKNDRKIAIGFCVHYLALCCAINTSHSGEYLKKDESICRRAVRLVKALSNRHVSDQCYIQYKNEFDIIFLNKITINSNI